MAQTKVTEHTRISYDRLEGSASQMILKTFLLFDGPSVDEILLKLLLHK